MLNSSKGSRCEWSFVSSLWFSKCKAFPAQTRHVSNHFCSGVFCPPLGGGMHFDVRHFCKKKEKLCWANRTTILDFLLEEGRLFVGKGTRFVASGPCSKWLTERHLKFDPWCHYQEKDAGTSSQQILQETVKCFHSSPPWFFCHHGFSSRSVRLSLSLSVTPSVRGRWGACCKSTVFESIVKSRKKVICPFRHRDRQNLETDL